MTFLHAGLAAAGLACVAIPIIIHLLFRRRRKPIQWAAMRFLIEAMRKQRRRLQLEQLLLLLARCLVIACAAAAIGRPALEKAGLLGGGSSRTVYFLLDNGLASTVRDESGSPAFERLKKLAIDQIEALGASDRVGLITLGGPAQALVVPASADRGAVSSLIGSLTPTDARTDLVGGLETLASRLKAEQEANGAALGEVGIVIVSDFLQGSADVVRPLPPTLAGLKNFSLIATQPAVNKSTSNVQVTAIEPLHSVVITGQGGNTADAPVRVSLRRAGTGASQPAVSVLRLGLWTDDARPVRPPTAVNVRWEAGQTQTTVTVQLSTDPGSARETGRGGSQAAVLVAELDRDALAGDNVYRRPIDVRDALQVGVIAQRTFGRAGRVDRLSADQWLRLALQPGATTPIESIDIEPTAVDMPVLSSLDAAFVAAPDLLPADSWAKLRRFVDAGGLLLVTPPAEATVHLWSDAFIESMGLSWRLSREPTVFTETPAALDDQHKPGTIFALIEPELVQLAKPVRITKALLPEGSLPDTDVLLRLRDERPWLIAATLGAPNANEESSPSEQVQASRGLVVYLASAPVLSWTDLPSRPLMVPMVQELVKQGVGRAAGSSTAIAGFPVTAPGPAGAVRDLQPVGESAEEQTRVDVDAHGSATSALRHAGLYRAADQAGRSVGVLAVNADTDAGRVETQDPATVRAWLSGALGAATEEAGTPRVAWLDAKQSTGATEAGHKENSPVSFPLLLAAFVLAVMETFMARWFSHAKQESVITTTSTT